MKENTKVNAKKQADTVYARKVCFLIAIFGMAILYCFNWNFNLIFTGNQYTGKVLAIEKERGEWYQILIAFTKENQETIQTTVEDGTGEKFLFFIEEGDELKLWVSKDEPFRYYVPFVNITSKLFILIFFNFFLNSANISSLVCFLANPLFSALINFIRTNSTYSS